MKQVFALLLLMMVLAGCGSPANVGQQTLTGSMPVTPSLLSPTAPTSVVHGNWQTYTDPQFGFRLDVPRAFSLDALRQIGGEDDLLWGYDLQNGPLPAEQAALADASLTIFAATGTNASSSQSLEPSGPYTCTAGTPITIGSDIPAYQQETYTNPTPTSGHGAAAGPFVSVRLEIGGVYLNISLHGSDSTHFLAKYGAAWQHMLASFRAGPPISNTHPCN